MISINIWSKQDMHQKLVSFGTHLLFFVVGKSAFKFQIIAAKNRNAIAMQSSNTRQTVATAYRRGRLWCVSLLSS